jgi:hypothetical protein
MTKSIKSGLRAKKEWLSLKSAAQEISEKLGEEFTLEEVLQYGLDKSLVLSVNFETKILVRPGKWVNSIDIQYNQIEISGRVLDYMTSVEVDQNQFVNFTDKAIPINGLFDLPLLGTEQKFVAAMIDPKRGIITPSQSIHGAFVVDPNDWSNIFQIITNYDEPCEGGYASPLPLTRLTSTGEHMDGCFIATQLPAHTELVIRREKLSQFVQIVRDSHLESTENQDGIPEEKSGNELMLGRYNDFNRCIEKAINEFYRDNDYYPSTTEEVLCRLFNKKIDGITVTKIKSNICINGSICKDLGNFKRNIKNVLKQFNIKRPY